MPTKLEWLMDGSVGRFWPIVDGEFDLEAEPIHGFLRLQGDNAALDVLDDRPIERWTSTPEQIPQGFLGSLAESAVLLLEAEDVSWRTQIGNAKASSGRYHVRTVVLDIPFDRVRSQKLYEMQADFLGIGRLVGLRVIREEAEVAADGRTRSVTISLGKSTESVVRLPRGRELFLTTGWSVLGPEDDRRVLGPVSIGCRVRKPTDVWELEEPLLFAQDLLGFARQGFVAAIGGDVTLDVRPLDDPRRERTPGYWSRFLMTAPGDAARSGTQRPLFYFDDIGGVRGIARWIKLYEAHPRAVTPIVGPYRWGFTNAATTILEVAAGMEYWVNAHKGSGWVQGKNRGRKVHVIAAHVGTAFRQWVGDTDKWATLFWETYNSLKHEPSFKPVHSDLADLARSGRHLLGAELLNRVAGSKAPGRRIFESGDLHSLGARLRSQLV
jgi:hypothetical protein